MTFRPRSAVATPPSDLRTTVLGTKLSLPFILAPVGSSRMFYPRGEELAARAAGAAGTAYTLSTLSGCRLEDVKRATSGPAWYQLYLVGGRDCALATMERARAVGFTALVLTVDTPVAGLRERDVRNGSKELLTRKIWPSLPFLPQMLARPRWLAGFLADGGLMKFPNIILPDGPMLYADVATALEQSTVTWRDLGWIRDAWKGPIIVKGVHTDDDARKAVDNGASAIVVSNHGGRQLDSVKATIRVLPEVVTAVRGQVEVMLDGKVIAPVAYGRESPGVQAYWKISNDPQHPRVGFAGQIELPEQAAGRHWLGLRLHARDGSAEDWSEQPIEVVDR